MLVGVVIAFQLAFPVLNLDLEWTTFGRLRPVHTSGVIFAFGASLMLLSADSPLLATLAAVAIVAGAAAASDILTQSMMQLAVPNALRGRAMGVWVLAIGFAPLGHLEMGGLAELLGSGPALFANGAALLVVGVIVAIAVPRLRQL